MKNLPKKWTEVLKSAKETSRSIKKVIDLDNFYKDTAKDWAEIVNVKKL